jgi:hypothetical protein
MTSSDATVSFEIRLFIRAVKLVGPASIMFFEHFPGKENSATLASKNLTTRAGM